MKIKGQTLAEKTYLHVFDVNFKKNSVIKINCQLFLLSGVHISQEILIPSIK